MNKKDRELILAKITEYDNRRKRSNAIVNQETTRSLKLQGALEALRELLDKLENKKEKK